MIKTFGVGFVSLSLFSCDGFGRQNTMCHGTALGRAPRNNVYIYCSRISCIITCTYYNVHLLWQTERNKVFSESSLRAKNNEIFQKFVVEILPSSLRTWLQPCADVVVRVRPLVERRWPTLTANDDAFIKSDRRFCSRVKRDHQREESIWMSNYITFVKWSFFFNVQTSHLQWCNSYSLLLKILLNKNT